LAADPADEIEIFWQQVHKSHIVKYITGIEKVSGNRIFFDQEKYILLGRRYREGVVVFENVS